MHRFNHLQTMIISTLIRSIVVLFFTTVSTQRSPAILFVLAFLEYVAAAFYDPARRSLLPRIVRPEDMGLASIIDGMTWSSMMAFGSAIGGLITAAVGIHACFLIDSLCYVVATMLAMIVWVDRPEQLEGGNLCNEGRTQFEAIGSDEPVSPPFFSMVKDMITSFGKNNPLVILACFCKMAAAIGWGVTNVIVINFSQTNVSLLSLYFSNLSLTSSVYLLLVGIG